MQPSSAEERTHVFVITKVKFKERVVDDSGGKALIDNVLEKLDQPLDLVDEDMYEVVGIGALLTCGRDRR